MTQGMDAKLGEGEPAKARPTDQISGAAPRRNRKHTRAKFRLGAAFITGKQPHQPQRPKAATACPDGRNQVVFAQKNNSPSTNGTTPAT